MASLPTASGSAPAPPAPLPKDYRTDPALWIFTSLTAGSSHIVTATSRLETILRANRVPFKAVDLSTDSKARQLWARRAGKDAKGRVRKLPGLVQDGDVLGDLFEIEEWNEYGELKQHVTIYFDEFTQPKKGAILPKPKYGQPKGKTAYVPAAPPPLTKEEAAKEPKPATVGTKIDYDAATAKSVAGDAAARAKQMKAQSLRDKVGAATAPKSTVYVVEKPDQAEKPTAASTETPAPAPAAETTPQPDLSKQMSVLSIGTSPSATSLGIAAAGLQSPTSGAWKGGEGGIDDVLHTVQSPTSSSWKPTETGAPVTTFSGANISSASMEEIASVEAQETIKEESEPEDEQEKKKAEAAKS